MQGEPAKLTDSTTATMFGGDKKGWGKVIEIHCGMEQMLFAVSSHPFQLDSVRRSQSRPPLFLLASSKHRIGKMANNA